MKLKKKSFLNSVCLLSVLLVAGTTPALAQDVHVDNLDDLATLMNGGEVGGISLSDGDNVIFDNDTLLKDIVFYAENISASNNDIFTSTNITLPEGTKLNVKQGDDSTLKLVVSELSGENSGGRNGVAGQIGFKWTLGKDTPKSTPDSSSAHPVNNVQKFPSRNINLRLSNNI